MSIKINSKAVSNETKCKEKHVSYYEYNEFYDLTLITDAQSSNYYVKLPITFESDYGDIHVVFAESNETTNINRAYEFALGSYGNTLCEIRRKDDVHEKRNFNGNRFADYRIPTSPTKFNVELSISKDGVVQMKDLDKNFKFNFTDQLSVIPVKYVAFAGYRGSRTKVTFDCDEVPHPPILQISTVVTETTTVEVTKTFTESSSTEAVSTVAMDTLSKDEDTINETTEIVPKSTTVILMTEDSNDETNEIAPVSLL